MSVIDDSYGNKSGGRLIDKSKKELISIIFRKDDVERKLTEQVNELKKTNSELNEIMSNIYTALSDDTTYHIR